jgi:chemotaxis protein MotA
VVEEDHQFYLMIREVLVANLHNHATMLCIEVGRQNAPGHHRPGYIELEDALRTLSASAAA